LILDVIENKEKIFKPKILKTYYVYTSIQQVFEDFSKLHSDVVFTPNIDDIPKNLEGNVLVIYDDKMMQFQSYGNTFIADLFIQKNHHFGIFAVVILQSLFPKNLKCVTNNATYHIVFPNFRDQGCLTYLARQIRPGNPKFIQLVMRESFKKIWIPFI